MTGPEDKNEGEVKKRGPGRPRNTPVVVPVKLEPKSKDGVEQFNVMFKGRYLEVGRRIHAEITQIAKEEFRSFSAQTLFFLDGAIQGWKTRNKEDWAPLKALLPGDVSLPGDE